MKKSLLSITALCALAGTASAQHTIEFLTPGFLLTDLSLNGAVGCGNVQGDGSFETFRWTSEGGIVRLGRSTVAVTGTAAGSPDISHDGTRISATILSSDNRQTQGIWDQSTEDWFEVFPPMTPDGVISDQSYASAWGLSGDGSTITGFYYSNWSGPTRARPSTWSQSTGVVALPSNAGVSCRVNASNLDGSIVGGWEDHGGPRWPTVWRNGVKMNVQDADGGGGGQVYDVNDDGSILAGQEYSEAVSTRVATIWTWNGSAYVMQNIGMLPGTTPGNGQAYFNAIAADGSIAVGSNIYTLSPQGDRAGIVWTPSNGLMDATVWIASLGLDSQIPEDMVIREMTAVSPDGSTITGIGLSLSAPIPFQSFVIRLAPPPCLGDADDSLIVDFTDVLITLANFGSTGAPWGLGDTDGDGDVEFFDILTTLANFGANCGAE